MLLEVSIAALISAPLVFLVWGMWQLTIVYIIIGIAGLIVHWLKGNPK